MTTTALRSTTLKVDQGIKERIKRLADARHRTPHRIMLDAISEYVEREEKREAFRQEGIRAWEEYQATGLHVTHDEADAWLAKLEQGQDVEPPACHV
ncbi:MAG TPA: CopG family ribbon-helix-helix protein [Gallionella sp.]|nr:CopG family ribbon-helix-helix protein [Gallionella sp.]